MIIKNSHAVTKQAMTMAGAERVEMQVLCGPDDGCPNFAMRKFTVAPGGCTPKHAHDYEHEIFVISGRGVAVTEAGEKAFHTGDALYVQANEVHQFRNVGDAALQFICLVPAFVHRPGGAAAAVDCGCEKKAEV
jgi:quercetin dioxygenase-like cupin family protein